MKQYIVPVFIILSSILVNAQIISKPPVDNETYKKFHEYSVASPSISNNGKWIAYSYSAPETGSVLVIESVDGKFKREFKDAFGAVFTEDNRWVIFNSSGGLIFLDLIKKRQQIKNGGRFSVPEKGDGRWLSFQQGQDVIIRDLRSETEKTFSGGTSVSFNSEGTIATVETDSTLQWVSLPSLQARTIYHGSKASNLTFDPSGTRCSFVIGDGDENVIYEYSHGLESAKILVNSSSAGVKTGMKIVNGPLHYSADGKRLFFKLSEAIKKSEKDSSVITDNLDLWNYKDAFLQSAQLVQIKTLSKMPQNFKYTAVASVADGKVVQLEDANAKIVINGTKDEGEYVVVENFVNDRELFWNTSYVRSYTVISTRDGSRKVFLPKAPLFMTRPTISAKEKFVIWYDPSQKMYMSYETETGIIRKLTPDITVPLWKENVERPVAIGNNYGIAGWLPEDKGFFVYDKYDIWQVDPLGKKAAVNITGGYGRQNEISFRISQEAFKENIFQPSQTLLLTAFNNKKQNGFWKKKLNMSGYPAMLNMASCLYYFPESQVEGISHADYVPVKARDAEVYLVTRETATEFPNWYITTDLKSYRKLTNVHPEKNYNWMTSELINWKMLDGKTSQGILYKPEDFDSSKKYPVIFQYYEKRSDALNFFRGPELSMGALDISWYVSNGYLVFEPDIYYTIGHPAKSAVNSVVSAANYLSKLAYVDASKMGLQGHSFGGFETNWIIANSTLFAAAQEGAGPSDMISMYGGLSHGENSIASPIETAQLRMGTTPWISADLFIENSPIFNVDKITTPLMIMHNKEDNAVPFAQAVEIFTALRRLQKPVWLLQYDGESHTIGDEKNKLDFTIRQQQFFDHYLKGKPAPVWMVEGINARDKGLKSGLKLSEQ